MKKYILIFLTLALSATGITHAQTLKDLENNFSKMAIRDSKIEEYLRSNGIFNAQGSPEGIYYTVSEQGKGISAKPGDYVTVHYTGTLLDGTKFDSSKDRGTPFSFQIGMGRVIQGWEKGIPLFPVGGKGKIFLPSQLAYGERGAGAKIPANTPLIFEIEVIEVTPQAEYAEKMRIEQELQRNTANLLAAAQKATDKAVIEEYAKEKGLNIQTTPSGLAYVIEAPGMGEKVKIGQVATVHYAGYLTNGTKFDSSFDRNEPFSLTVGIGQVIAGWDEGLQLLAKGGKAKLILPSGLAYGPRGAGGVIPPNTVLVFDVEVLNIQ